MVALLVAMIAIGVFAYLQILSRGEMEVPVRVTIPTELPTLSTNTIALLYADLSTVDLNYVPDSLGVAPGDVFFIALALSDEGYAVPGAISVDPDKNNLFLKGTVQSIEESVVRMDYGIEHFSVPLEYRALLSEYAGRQVEARVSVKRSGSATLRYLNVGNVLINERGEYTR